jgi:hypothetical protein
MSSLSDTIAIGTSISFRSKSASDTRQLTGVFEGSVSYTVARSYLDPRSYNELIRQSDPTVSSDVTTLSYFLITLESVGLVLFADEWIANGSLATVDGANFVTIQVTDPHHDNAAILSLLMSGGYFARVVS